MSDDIETRTLRPTTWDDYIGQTQIKEQLRTKAVAALNLRRPIGHILLTGEMGCGKTTLAHLVAAETGDWLEVIARKVDERGLMQHLWEIPNRQGICFIDEAHRLSPSTQEGLLTLLEEGFIQTKWGPERFPWLTLILATTERRKINKPLRSRCTDLRLADYTHDEMKQIVEGMARRAEVTLDDEMHDAFATAACGQPRAARHLVLGAEELAASGQDVTVDAVLKHCGIERDGLRVDHMRFLATLRDLGGQSGLDNLSSQLGVAPQEIQETERLLIARGYVRRDTQGRMLMAAGRARLEGRELRPLREMAS